LYSYSRQNPTGAAGEGVFKRGEAPLFNILPLPYQGRGIKGVGYHKKEGETEWLIISYCFQR